MKKVVDQEHCLVIEDCNGHVGRGSEAVRRIHGGYGYGEENDEGNWVIDFAVSYDMIIAKTLFQKRPEQLTNHI